MLRRPLPFAIAALAMLTACSNHRSSPTGAVTPPSNDARLTALVLSAGELTPAFAADVFAYAATVQPEVEAVVVTASTAQPTAGLTVNGAATTPGVASAPVALAPGANTLTVAVTAPDGVTTATTVIEVTRLVRPVLTALTVSTGKLAPGFAPTTTAYGAATGFLIRDVRVTATTDADGATLTVNGLALVSGEASPPLPLAEGDNDFVVRVTDALAVSRDYVVRVHRDLAAEFAVEAYAKASNTGAFDEFGYAVAIDGDTMAVGAYREDSAATGVNGDQADNSALDSGAVYVFVRDGIGWAQQAYLKASNTGATDFFGFALALRGDTLAVGAYNEDSAATGVNGDQGDDSAADSGAVYVFVRDGAAWTQQAYVKASNTGAGDGFGVSVALGDDRLVVGAYHEDSAAMGVDGDQASNAASDSGAVYVFARDGATWTQQAYVKASNTGAEDEFGLRLALAGDSLAVAAYGEDSAATGVGGNQASNAASDSGAVYVFVRDATTWTQQAYVKASNTGGGDQFGIGIALDGDTLAVGANQEDSSATGIGGNQASNGAANSGAVYVFVRDGATWTQQAYVKASNTGGGDQFGLRVALSGDRLAVGAPQEDGASTGVNGNQASNAASNSGAVYLFVRAADGWQQAAYVKASNTEAGDQFGLRVALAGDTLVVGATGEDGNATGINGGQFANGATNSGAVFVVR